MRESRGTVRAKQRFSTGRHRNGKLLGDFVTSQGRFRATRISSGQTLLRVAQSHAEHCSELIKDVIGSRSVYPEVTVSIGHFVRRGKGRCRG